MFPFHRLPFHFMFQELLRFGRPGPGRCVGHVGGFPDSEAARLTHLDSGSIGPLGPMVFRFSGSMGLSSRV